MGEVLCEEIIYSKWLVALTLVPLISMSIGLYESLATRVNHYARGDGPDVCGDP